MVAGVGRAMPRKSARKATECRPSHAVPSARSVIGPRAAAGHNSTSIAAITPALAKLGNHGGIVFCEANTAWCQRRIDAASGATRRESRSTSSNFITIISQPFLQPRMRPREPRRHRPHGAAQRRGHLLIRQLFHVTQQHRGP